LALPQTPAKLPKSKGFLSGDSAAETLPAGMYSLTDGRNATDVARVIRCMH